MKQLRSFSTLMTASVIAVFSASCTSAPPVIQTGPDAEISFDGLHKVDNSMADEAWAKSDFDISGYSKIMFEGGGIEYRPVKNKGRSSLVRSGTGPYFIDDGARSRFEALVNDVFREELQKIEQFTFVEEAGPDVLMVRGEMLNVTSYVPPQLIGGRSSIYLRSVGEATLVLELRDSETNAILARSIDRRVAEMPGHGMLEASRERYATAVKRVIKTWATRLREGLDGFGH